MYVYVSNTIQFQNRINTTEMLYRTMMIPEFCGILCKFSFERYFIKCKVNHGNGIFSPNCASGHVFNTDRTI